MEANKDAYPAWIINGLLTVTTSLLLIAIILAAATYTFAKRRVRLEDLSSGQRQQLVNEAHHISPPVFQRFPLSGQILFYHMVPNTQYVNVTAIRSQQMILDFAQSRRNATVM